MAKYKSVTIEDIGVALRNYFPDAPLDRLQKAYIFAEKAHQGQMRSSGDPYIIHPTEVAHSLAEMRMDISSIITGLLHDTVEDTAATLEDIEREFGKDVKDLVDGVTKLSKITFKTSEEKQAENFRKMIIAMAKDIRVIIVKLADRLNNMRTLEFLPAHKQLLIAQETLDIYAPIANRLGMGWIKIELEDLALRYIHPDAYYKLAQKVATKKDTRENYIEELTSVLDEKLKEYEVKAVISGRAKHFYSIFKKMERRNVDFDQVFDVIAFRIVVDNITECYKSLGVIHAGYKPVPGRFKDYIAIPKANGYQSLHTTVIGPTGERVEIQIRTQDMHTVAEKGIAAHWQYKEGRFDTKAKDNIEWVQRLLEWQKDLDDPNEFLETVKIDLFAEDVFVFTPKGEVKELAFGSTPIDFAFAVHTNVGLRCIGAKVNGRIVPLKHRLKSGDTVEVITGAHPNPSKDWLKIAKTSKAKAKIRAAIKTTEREKAMELGRELLEKALKPFAINLTKAEKDGKIISVSQEFNLKIAIELYTAIGYGRILPEAVVQKMVPRDEFEKFKKETPEPQVSPKRFNQLNKKKTDSRAAITVADLDDILIRFGRCCNPLPGDPIVGFITRGRGVTIHTANCTKAIDTDPERRVDVQWNIKDPESGPMKRSVKIRVLSHDEPGLLAVMSQTISGMGVNIASANIRTTKDRKAICLFDVEVQDIQHLQRVLSALESKPGVINVDRVRA